MISILIVVLYSMETACHSPMHYWDMTMDSDMIVPTDSIMFSEEFYGNGDGIVRTGPFAHWRTPIGTPVIRNIGSGNLLIEAVFCLEFIDFIDFDVGFFFVISAQPEHLVKK